MRPLPIDAIRSEFDAALSPRARLVISAPTGSGKSTRLPLWMADHLRGPVLVVEPRRVACRALATFVARARGESVGATVGYRVRFDDASSPQTQVLFVTPGMALALLGDSEGPRFAGVLVDEFHERSWENDLLTALAHRGRMGEHTALVVCSATLEIEALTTALGATHLEGSGRMFDVSLEHRGGGGPTLDGLDLRVRDAVAAAGDARDGDVLVFLPGKREISECSRALAGLSSRMRPTPLHGGLSSRAMSDALRSSPTRRVFLATNVAETSLTIPSVTTVIDSGLVRRRMHRSGKVVLAVVPISNASAEQRRGRAGRVQAGACVRLWSASFSLEAATPPEVECVEMDDVLLRCGMCGVRPVDARALPWVTPLPEFAVAASLRRLQDRGAVGEDGDLTPAGRAQARLPVSWVAARILAQAPASLAGTLCDLVAGMEVGRDFLEAATSAEQEEARADLFEDALDEVDVLLRCVQRGDAAIHGLRARTLQECRRLSKSLRKTLRVRDGAPPARDALVAHLLDCAPELAFVRRPRADRARGGREGGRSMGDPWGNGEHEVMLWPYRVPGVEDGPKPPRAGLLLEREWVGSGQRARGVGRLLMGCRFEQLCEAGLGTLDVSEPKLERVGRRRAVTAKVERRFAGVLLQSDRQTLKGVELLDALVTLALRGRVLKGVADPLRDALHGWSVLEQWGRTTRVELPPAPVSIEDYLREKLAGLGVAELADLQLIEPDDIVPDIVAMAVTQGLDPRDAQALPKELPRRIDVPGGRYACTVDVPTRTVELIPIEGTKKEPAVGLLPRFRGFAVVFVKASRRLRLR